MPRRSILSATKRTSLLALPESQDDLIRFYTFDESDLALIRQGRGDANRIGFAVQLALLRYPGYALGSDMQLPGPIIEWIAQQVRAEASVWATYGERDETRRGASNSRNCAPISGFRRSACPTSPSRYRR